MSEDRNDLQDRVESLSHEHMVIVAERDRLRRQLDELDERLWAVVMAQHQLAVALPPRIQRSKT